MDQADFQKIIHETIQTIPKKLQDKIQNVVFTVEPEARQPQANEIKISQGSLLLGLYQGIPLTKRGINYSLVPPDKITFFQKNIELVSNNEPEKISKLLKDVVLHEIAHYFGFSEAEIRKIESEKGRI
ncbi:MAG: metallopeptidase family protein [Patescibacteria group bacterium]|jgi:predicted Zn-dependent protease with MMP-like domain